MANAAGYFWQKSIHLVKGKADKHYKTQKIT
jgi:hypothetical protein